MNIIQSIWNYKCPRCRKGDIYVKPLKYTDPLDMHDRCDHCNLKFEPEPGYFFGAMFISYGWTAWLSLFIVGFCMLVLGWSVAASFTLLIIIALLSYLFVLRISRVMYMHMDVKYNPDLAMKSSEKT